MKIPAFVPFTSKHDNRKISADQYYGIEVLLLSQDDVTGDGTTSTVLLIGEFLKQADVYISEGLHPR
jgi:hypothetical protein